MIGFEVFLGVVLSEVEVVVLGGVDAEENVEIEEVGVTMGDMVVSCAGSMKSENGSLDAVVMP